MSLRWGKGGPSAWNYCHEHGIVAMGYYHDVPTENGIVWAPVVRDCSKITEEECIRQLKAKLKNHPKCRKFLHDFIYETKIGDTIYIKEGPEIVGKGKVISDYKFDPEGIIKDNPEIQWEHYKEIEWDENFKPVKVFLGQEILTILELDKVAINKMLEAEKNNC